MSEKRTFKNLKLEQSIFRERVFVAFLFVILLVLVLVGRMLYLQVYQYDIYTTRSDKNRMHVRAIPPTRGLIFDRNGRILAENLPSYNLTFVRERAGDTAAVLDVLADILELSEEQKEDMSKQAYSRRRPFQSALLLSQLDDEQIARVSVNRYRLPGVDIEAQLIRHYPYGPLTAHILGYVSRISEKDLKKVDRSQYAGTHYIGKGGIERQYETALHGRVGVQTVETNARGRVLQVLSEELPEQGESLSLYLDAELQKVAARALAGFRGALVAIDPNTGGILAMVSTPSFDPNLFVGGINPDIYRQLITSPDLPMFDRTIRGKYPPASTIKAFMGLAGLEHGVVNATTTIYDPGWYQLPNDSRLYRNWKRVGHGKVNLKRSIVVSNDTYFYNLAYNLGIDRIQPFMKQFGFGINTALDLPGASSGLMPGREWKKAHRKLPWFPGETLSIGIGQGYWLATPLQIATSMVVLANRGKWVQPRIVEMQGRNQAHLNPENKPEDVSVSKPEYWDQVIDGMVAVVHSSTGTARRISKGIRYTMAGKTGTAQVKGIKQGEKYDASKLHERHRDHALFAGFAPVENPQIALAVVVENAGGGSTTAAPIARMVFDAWLTPERLKSTKTASDLVDGNRQ
ncbi:penicillin-binding protein 2 [Oceanospirillum sediminis]|uniref:Peptidoglycan D,D-transpeptidase MrdA n=1 Tax=Oceanospirillum sediminis TaxID=2760088 RepID=A0A839ILW7_9GAMM|nr:penicillin-binding protein 2 [Oceanospirillum sediminis]MBB1485512.1 penicillin-binding protein 2 [Oceanospirillum sediminis]